MAVWPSAFSSAITSIPRSGCASAFEFSKLRRSPVVSKTISDLEHIPGSRRPAPIKNQFNGVGGFRTYVSARWINQLDPSRKDRLTRNDRRSEPSNQQIGETTNAH